MSKSNSETQGWKENAQKLTPLVVIVPVGPNDSQWTRLLKDLCGLEPRLHVVLVVARDRKKFSGESFFKAHQQILESFEARGLDVEVMFSEPNRGRQINQGILNTEEPWIWVLHADTRLRRPCFHTLKGEFEKNPNRLFFFDLEFDRDGPQWMWANALGTRFRSRVLGLPFGDQGFAFSRTVFFKVGPFQERVKYGEDHLFVWKARHEGVPLQPLDARILTSARKYKKRGWLRTTSEHLVLTAAQATPQWIQSWFKKRC